MAQIAGTERQDTDELITKLIRINRPLKVLSSYKTSCYGYSGRMGILNTNELTTRTNYKIFVPYENL